MTAEEQIQHWSQLYAAEKNLSSTSSIWAKDLLNWLAEKINTNSEEMKKLSELKAATIQEEIEIICKKKNINVDLIKIRSRQPSISKPRAEVFKALREIGYSFPDIGKAFGMKHAIVIYQINRINAELKRKNPVGYLGVRKG